MAAIPRLAWRNLGRNLRRTFITGTALAIGVALSVAAYGLTDGLIATLLDSLTRFDLGHIQVHHPEFPRSRSLERSIDDPDAVIQAASELGVTGVAPRVYAFALLSNRGKSLGVELVGVDPTREPQVTRLHERILHGTYLDDAPTDWPRGRTLTAEELARDQALTDAAEDEALAEIEALDGLDELGELDAAPADTPEGATDDAGEGATDDAPEGATDDVPDVAPAGSRAATQELAVVQSPPPRRPPRILVGVALARILNVSVGDRVHATGQTADGQFEELYFEIAGIYQTGTSGLDRTRGYMHIADLQRFAHFYDRVHEISAVVSSAERAPAMAEKLQAALGDELLARSWQQIRPDIRRMVDLSSVSSSIMVFIIFFVAVLGVVNTMLMAVFERTRELGMLKAIGMSGRRIVALIVTETLFLVLIAATAGTLAGLGIDIYLVWHGWDLSSMTEGFSVGGVGVEPILYGAITPRGLIAPTAILSIMCVLASLYPAIRAARLQPAVGMRQT